MSILRRASLALVTTAAATVLGLLLAVRVLMTDGFARVETAEAQRNLDRAAAYAAREVDALERTVRDWSRWDATHDFVGGRAPDYADENLTEDGLENLDLDLAVFLDAAGTPVIALAAEGESYREAEWPSLAPTFAVLLEAASRGESASALVPVGGGAYLAAAGEVVRSNGEGPANGVVLFARRAEGRLDRALSEILRLDVALLPAWALDAAEAHEARGEALVSRGAIQGLDGRPALGVEIRAPRDTVAPGDEALLYVALVASLGVLACVGALGFFMMRVVTEPLSALTIRALEAEGPSRGPHPLDAREDEIGLLSREFGRALDRAASAVAEAGEARAAAERASQARSLFLAAMSHELRTPMNAIIGFSDAIRVGVFGPMDARHRGYVEDIHRSARHLLGLIEQVLEAASLEAGGERLTERWFDLPGCVAACVRMVEGEAARAGVSLRAGGDAADAFVFADELRIRQVLLNLLGNAVKFTPADGRVEIRVEPAAEGGLAVRVADTGVGMRPEDVDRATDAFAQVHDPGRHPRSGVGLGLAIAKRLAEAHGGRLAIESRFGRGTTVALVLPAWRTDGGAAPAPAPTPAPVETVRIAD